MGGRRAVFGERGRIGQVRSGGVFGEEFLYELRGRRGVEVYKEMADGDDIVGAMLFAVEMLIRQAEFDVEAGGAGEADGRAADFVRTCLNDMRESWQDTLSEMLSFLTFGWSYHEILYKRRLGRRGGAGADSAYDDGLIGWRGMPIRAQDTLARWEYGEGDELLGMTQMAPPDYAERFIPINKALHLITKSRKRNPEGRSILRNAYRAYYFKKRMQEIEGIGIERDLAGLPLLVPPEGLNLWDEGDPEMARMLGIAEELVRNVRRDSVEGIVLPSGWSLQLLSGAGRQKSEVGGVIERYDKRIAMTVMADFILLGSGNVGSFALSSDKTALFAVALGTYMDIICDAFNTQAIPRLMRLNEGRFPGLTGLPRLVHGDVEQPDLGKLGAFLTGMTGSGLLDVDDNLKQYVRRAASLPASVGSDRAKGSGEESGEGHGEIENGD